MLDEEFIAKNLMTLITFSRRNWYTITESAFDFRNNIWIYACHIQ